MSSPFDPWPPLELSSWKPTCETLHRWAQIVGKIRLGLAPARNHWWHVPLYVTARGLGTSAIPWRDGSFEIAFDLLAHALVVTTSAGDERRLPLRSRSVAAFHAEVLALLSSLGIEAHVWRMPVEIPDPIPFDEDEVHATYDPPAATRFFRVLSSAAAALEEFAGRFLGKQSPVHFFWGSFDLALTRFSGRRAPPRPGADRITAEAYSHEVMSVGFWPGTEGVSDAVFYAYAAPEPPGFRDAAIPPPGRWHSTLSEFVLPYADVRAAPAPRAAILAFCQAAYDAAAELGRWDREALERAPRAAESGPGALAPGQPTP